MKKAFSMLGLIFVITIIGILTATILPRINSNKLRQAAIQVVSHIRYTQHLAFVDDKYDAADAQWYKQRWQILFGASAYTDNKIAYSIYSDSGSYDGNPNISELAVDPMNLNKFLSGGDSGILYTSDSRTNKTMNIGLSYGISSVVFTGGCASGSTRRLTFDHMGRPIRGTIHGFTKAYESNKLIQSQCNIILTNSEGSITIAIEPETGYAHII